MERVPDRFTPLWKLRTVEEEEAGPPEMSKLKLAKLLDLLSVFGHFED